MPTFDATVVTYNKSGAENGQGLVRADGTKSANFKASEHNTQDLATYYCDKQLATVLDYVRSKISRGTNIYSGYRSGSSGLGVSAYSEHSYACAADIFPSTATYKTRWQDWNELWTVAKFLHDNASAYGIKGIGLYDYKNDTYITLTTEEKNAGWTLDQKRLSLSFIHVDVGRGTPTTPNREQRPARWYQWWKDSYPSGQHYCVRFIGSQVNNFANLKVGYGDPMSYLPAGSCEYGSLSDLVNGGGGGSGTTYSPSFVNYPERTRMLQLYLKMRGWYTTSVDGIYSTGTGNAVGQFQTNNSLTPVDGDISWNAGNTFPLMFPTLRLGDKDSGTVARTRNMNVKFLQKCLIALGYYLGSAGADGDFGGKTDEAVRAVQGTGNDGICGPNTWQQIATALRSKSITTV